MSTPNAIYWHALNIANNGNLWRLWNISVRLGGPAQVFNAAQGELVQAGMNPQAAMRLWQEKSKIKPQEEYEQLASKNIQMIARGEAGYPLALEQIHDAPPLIYIRGNPKALGQELVAIVGSRKLSTYGKNAIKRFVPALCGLNVGIVSGLAYGADSEALETCLEYDGSPVAVLASSLAQEELAPKANLRLAHMIESQGCLLSENAPGTFVGKMHFPLRNRIIAGLSRGILVIEAALKSGSLVTAQAGLEQGKEIFAVPGSIFSANSEGTLDLIKRGARCATSIADISQEFGWDIQAQQELKLSNPVHASIIACIAEGYNTFDAIQQRIHLTSNQLLTALTELELHGALQRGGNGVYHKAR